MPVSTVTPSRPPNCPHELRPGTTVCLLCRHAALKALRRRRNQIAARIIAGVLTLGVVTVLVVAASASIRDRRAAAARRPAPASVDSVPPATAPAPPTPDPSLASALALKTATAAPATTAAATATEAPAPAPPAVAPIIAEGRSELSDSVFAVRTGDTVRVVFDTQMGRTRRPDKFERIVRETLPAVYGPAADSALATIRPGALTGASDLLVELPTRGLEIPLAAGRTLALWPETRPGRDGPLVVMYRAVVRN